MKKRKKNPCLPCMLALNPPRKFGALLLLGLGGFLLLKSLSASHGKNKGVADFEETGAASDEGTTFEDAATAPIYGSTGLYPYPAYPSAVTPPAFTSFTEGQKHELVQSGLQQGLLTLMTCNKKQVPVGQSRYRNCRFMTAQGTTVKFDDASNFVFGRRY